MIVARNVWKSYPLQGFRRFQALRDLNLSLPPKTHIGIVGRNGAGKSTLLRILGRIELPDRGSVEVEGSVSPPFGLGSAFAPKLTALDNARFVCRVNGDSPRNERLRVSFIREFSELGDFFDRPVETYSSGMRARLAFSISMAYEYDYYLIDELTAVGDQKFKAKAKAAFDEKKGKASIIMVSHNLASLRQDCSVGVYIKDGRATYYDDIKNAIAEYNQDQKAV